MEMFAWKTAGKKMLPAFEPSFFEETRVLAANQGLYNGFLQF
jgi:putative membrane protein